MTAALRSAHRTKRQQSFMCSDTKQARGRPSLFSYHMNQLKGDTETPKVVVPQIPREPKIKEVNPKLTGDDAAEAKHHCLSQISQVTTDRATNKWERP
jgi:hypothetical protein